jgi:hypothetical protein
MKFWIKRGDHGPFSQREAPPMISRRPLQRTECVTLAENFPFCFVNFILRIYSVIKISEQLYFFC